VVMSNASDLMVVADQVFGTEVLVADTDVLLGDACDTLQFGRKSELLRAIDVGTAIAFMSEQTFHELGRVSALSARGRKVDHDALRSLIAEAYLPRIPVIRITSATGDCWLPRTDDVRDPDDIAHVQAARLIGARAVYSHDKDLRRPGFAPSTRDDYNQRVVHLSTLSARREAERDVGIVVGLTGGATSEAVSWASARFNVKPAVLWVGFTVVAVVLTYFALAPGERRRRIAQVIEPFTERLAEAMARNEAARMQLAASVLVPAGDVHRMEVRVATHLARHPDQTMGDIAEQLALSSLERRDLSSLLRAHPSFELSSRYGWSVGHTRRELTTNPPPWTPRSLAM
jgi:predicted nucleic acid-binding protein